MSGPFHCIVLGRSIVLKPDLGPEYWFGAHEFSQNGDIRRLEVQGILNNLALF